MKYTCIAIDDEPFALKQLEDYIKKTPFLQLVGSCLNAKEALEILSEKEVQVLFVDINMPGLNGLEFVKTLQDKYQVVFTTAYSKYAVESYRVNAVDYILKPISYTEFLRAANKLKDRLELKPDFTDQRSAHFFVKSDGKHVRIEYEQIHYIESLSEYVKIHLVSGDTILSLMRLKNLDTSLPSDHFMRVHRSFIVNLDRIKAVERARVQLEGEIFIPIGEQYKNPLKGFLDKNFL